MGVRQIILAAVLLAATPLKGVMAYAQSAPQPGDSPARDIAGQVVDSVTGQPIARALVQLGNQRAVLTDHEGHFEFAGSPGDRFFPWATKPGYFSSMRAGDFAESNGPNPSDEKPVTLKLVPEAILSGTVDDEGGQPLQGIPVQLKVFRTMNGRGLWTMRQQIATNAEGEFRFSDLEAGKYTLTTGFHMDGLPDSRSSIAYVPVHYPAATASQPDNALTLVPGQHIEANLDPQVEKLYPVTGIVSGYGISAGAAFEVETREGEPLQPFTHFDLRTGEFRLLLPGGSYEVKATAYGPVPLQGRQIVSVPQAPVNGVLMNLEPFATIPVEIETQVVNSAGNGPQPPPPSFVSVSLSSSDATGFGSYFGAQPRHHQGGEEQGPLFIENLPPGRYTLQATPPAPWYVASASCGSLDLTREELAVTGAAAGCSIRVVLRNDSASLHCVVRNPSQSKNVFLYLLPMADLTLQMRMNGLSATSQSAEADFSDLAPGRYLVLAMASDQQSQQEQIPYRDPEAMRRYMPLGQEVTLTANGKADVQLDIAAPDVASGAQ